MYAPHHHRTFGETDVPVAGLPQDFQACIKSSASGQSTIACDTLVGSKLTGLGYCAQKAYQDMTYCGCVNAGVSTPECIFAPCADNTQAYRTTTMQAAMANATENCPSTINCVMVRAMGGADNVTKTVAQPINCYGFVPWLMEHLTAVVLLLILVAVLATLIGYYYVPERRRRAARSAQAPPATKPQKATP